MALSEVDGVSTIAIESPVGRLVLGATERGLVSCSFGGGGGGEGESGPSAARTIAAEAVEQLTAYFAGARKTFDVPLDVRGTDFQRSVWDSLRAIPFGEMVSYGEVAKRIGNPKAVRAVGGANNRNPLPIFVPCHRVVNSAGGLHGYGGGLPAKQWLLKHEGCAV